VKNSRERKTKTTREITGQERKDEMTAKTDAPEMVGILEVRKETPSVHTLVLDKKAVIKPGQFYMVWIHDLGEKPYACSRSAGNVELTIKRTGPFSEKLSGLKKGDLVGIRGPYGNGRFTVKGKDLCFIAGGLGIVPLISLIESLKKAKKKVTVILGARTKAELLFADRIKKAGAVLLIATDDGSAGEKCLCHQLFQKTLESKRFDQAFCCGPEAMMSETLKIVLKEKIPCQMSLERYMKCGIGICGSCALDPSGLLVCRDGPVFESAQLKDSEFGKYRRDASGSKVKI
jgi:dihydroorotate dehydrogenase electron transfer subunit